MLLISCACAQAGKQVLGQSQTTCELASGEPLFLPSSPFDLDRCLLWSEQEIAHIPDSITCPLHKLIMLSPKSAHKYFQYGDSRGSPGAQTHTTLALGNITRSSCVIVLWTIECKYNSICRQTQNGSNKLTTWETGSCARQHPYAMQRLSHTDQLIDRQPHRSTLYFKATPHTDRQADRQTHRRTDSHAVAYEEHSDANCNADHYSEYNNSCQQP